MINVFWVFCVSIYFSFSIYLGYFSKERILKDRNGEKRVQKTIFYGKKLWNLSAYHFGLSL